MISGLFLGTSLLVIVVPGPDATLIAQLVLRTGVRTPAAFAAAGMISAGIGHALLAVTGVSLLLSTRPAVFTALQWCGAALMLVWGVRAVLGALRQPAPEAAPPPDGPAAAHPADDPLASATGRWTPWRSFGLGAACTGSNPKVGLFLLAYLPQFVPPGAPAARSITLLATVYLSLGALWLTFLVLSIHQLHVRTLARRRTGRAQLPVRVLEAVAGAVFIAFAVRLAYGA